ncbi:MAG: ketoacyl-ACP synthase III [Planctomycetota bacterium]|jgi:3-oxoacyl-[acyl-carrier-protein] synthase-3
MAVADISGVRIAGITSTVPETMVTPDDDARHFGEPMDKVADSIGVWKRHRTPANGCVSDMCQFSAEHLLERLGWERESIQLVVFISQTADYILPATACTLQHRLGLSTQCAAFDVNLGCSAYPYGIWLASQMLTSFRGGGRALLLVGDTASRPLSPQDRSTIPLFGDAATATAIEVSEDAAPMQFVLGTDGAGAPHLMIPAGGHRLPRSEETAIPYTCDDGIVRSEDDLHMNGAEVFAFALREVPKLVKATLKASDSTVDDFDGIVFHQANTFMMNHLTKRLKVPAEKFPFSLARYGNTASASIPLAINDQWGNDGEPQNLKLLMAGFGVGWSWASAVADCQRIVLPKVLTMPDAAFPEQVRSKAAA